MIVPPASGETPPEAERLYPAGVRFTAVGLGLGRLTPDGYDAVISRVGVAAADLAKRGAAAVALMGTSLSFYRGPEANAELISVMREASGLPVTTMSDAVVEALQAVGGRRIAAATAYGAEVNRRLVAYLEHAGFDVVGVESLGIEEVRDVFAVTDADLLDLGLRAAAAAPNADALLISCGGLRTLDVTPALEMRTGLPVVSSALAGAWAAVRLVGMSGRAPGWGRLLDCAA